MKTCGYKQIGLGCSFLDQRCTNKTVYPYLCDGAEEQFGSLRGRSTCTYDHLSKVSKLRVEVVELVII